METLWLTKLKASSLCTYQGNSHSLESLPLHQTSWQQYPLFLQWLWWEGNSLLYWCQSTLPQHIGSLSKLQDNVREVAWDIRECKTYELDRSSFEHSFKLGIFNGFLDDIMNVLAETLFWMDGNEMHTTFVQIILFTNCSRDNWYTESFLVCALINSGVMDTFINQSFVEKHSTKLWLNIQKLY